MPSDSSGKKKSNEMALSTLLSHNNYLLRHFSVRLPKYVRTMTILTSPLAAPEKKQITWGNPLNLPSLPVPKLQQTLDKYLQTVEPLLNEEEFKRTIDIVQKFGSGAGAKLQELLVKKAKNSENWLSDWWINVAYLGYRDPVVVFSSPGLVFPFQNFNGEDDRVEYTAKLIRASLDFKSLIDSDKLPIDKMGKDPLDMNQYKKIFGTCRIPGLKQDTLEFNPQSKHIVLIKNNNFFKMEVLGENNKALSEKQLCLQLQSVIKESASSGPEIGVLTTENRDTWGKVYHELIKDEKNKLSLNEIQSSLFVVCLDRTMPKSGNDNRQTTAGKQFIHGGGSSGNAANRWYDKTVQFVVGEDGSVGLTYEHSPSEGQPIAVMTDYLVDYINKNAPSTEEMPSSKSPQKLEFNVNDSIKNAIKTANENVDKLVKNLELDAFTFKEYGKDFPKSQKLSPDSFLQMAMQFAYYRIYKKPAAHYESAALRKYIHGRTETIRSCSKQSVRFAKVMLSEGTSNEEKATALRAAVEAHKKYTVEALNGFGIDRHLLGLKLIALENNLDVPEFYKDPAFLRSTHFSVTSSQVATLCDGFMCYGPVVPDGYGCCYNPRPKDINFAVSAFAEHPDTSATKFRQALEASLLDMHDVLAKTQKAKL